jgi:hypothetical protein
LLSLRALVDPDCSVVGQHEETVLADETSENAVHFDFTCDSSELILFDVIDQHSTSAVKQDESCWVPVQQLHYLLATANISMLEG